MNYSLIDVGEVRLNVVEAGPPDGELLVLLHGFPEFHYGWRHQMAPLAEAGFHVVAPDQRGYNLSDKPVGVNAYRVEHMARDVIGLMDHFGVEQACIAGHDWGAAVAWETALRYPARVRKLAILNVPHPDVMGRFLRSSWRQIRKSWYIFFFQIPGLPEALFSRNGYAGLAQLLRRSGKAGAFSDADIAEYVQAWSQPGALSAMINWYRAALRGGLGGKGRRVSPSTLVLWGKQDVALSAEMAEPSVDLCDQGRLVFYEDATHWVQHDKAEEVIKELQEFFSRN